MEDIRVESVAEPFASDPRLARLGLGLFGRAQVMGFLPHHGHGVFALDLDMVSTVMRAAADAGVGQDAAAVLRVHEREESDTTRTGRLANSLERMIDALDASPHPAGEWEAARDLLGDDLLADLVGGISASSLHRYVSGQRPTPDPVAWRLHVIARVLAALLGSYNSYGIRRWWQRPRTALDGKSPALMLTLADTDDDEEVARVLELAIGLEGAGAAS